MSLATIKDQLARHRALRLPGRRQLIRAAVAVVLCEQEGDLSVLLVQRAQRDGDPWSGHMAFPGGRLDASDPGGGGAACREAYEETGLVLKQADRVGRLHDRVTRAHRQPLPMVVSPFVYALEKMPSDWQLNYEVDKTVWVPLAYLADHSNREKMTWRVGPVPLKLPCYHYQGYHIWGLTLLMLDELMRLTR